MKALSIKNLKKTYSNGNQALKGIDLSVEAGDFYALLGPNGAGKTTAIGIVSSLVNKSGGVVEVFGHSIDTELEAAKACIGIVPQEVNVNLWDTVGNIVRNQAGYYGLGGKLAKQRVEKYLRALRLWDRRDDIARSLSGGMKRRLMIARALVHGVVPRRAHRWRRHRDSPLDVGVFAGNQRSRYDDHPDYALSRRGGVLVQAHRHY